MISCKKCSCLGKRWSRYHSVSRRWIINTMFSHSILSISCSWKFCKKVIRKTSNPLVILINGIRPGFPVITILQIRCRRSSFVRWCVRKCHIFISVKIPIIEIIQVSSIVTQQTSCIQYWFSYNFEILPETTTYHSPSHECISSQ